MVLALAGPHFENHVTEHLDEAAVTVPGECLIAGMFGEGLDRLFVEADVEHRVHHARHRFAGTRTAGDEQRVVLRTQLRSHHFLDLFQRLGDLLAKSLGIGSVVVAVVVADLGWNGVAGRDLNTNPGHFGEVGSLAAERVLHFRRSIGFATTKEVDVFGLISHGIVACSGKWKSSCQR